jgi:hypothetical protein
VKLIERPIVDDVVVKGGKEEKGANEKKIHKSSLACFSLSTARRANSPPAILQVEFSGLSGRFVLHITEMWAAVIQKSDLSAHAPGWAMRSAVREKREVQGRRGSSNAHPQSVEAEIALYRCRRTPCSRQFAALPVRSKQEPEYQFNQRI